MSAPSADFALLGDLAVLLGVSTVVVVACHRLKLPTVVGLLLTGILAGPHGLGLIGHAHAVELLAEVGVVLLMFVIGAELSLGELMRLKRPVFMGGGLQVGATIAMAAGLMGVWGAGLGQAVFYGFLAALSSTAIVLKLMSERAELESPQGRIVLAVLIFQDLVVVPMMLLTPLLGDLQGGLSGSMLSTLGWLMFKAAAFTGGIFVVARTVVPRVLARVVATRSREAVLLTSLGVCLAIAYLTSLLGLSLSLGAFLAGLVISESEYSLSALDGVLPFRDVFTSLFFISMGMLLDVGFFWAHPWAALGLGLGVAVLKALMAGGAALALGYPLRTAVLAGMALAQIGEFSFVLARSGQSIGLLGEKGYQLFLAASILTMCATPMAMRLAPGLARLAQRLPMPDRFRDRPDTAAREHSCEDHLVIAGYGPIGRHLAQAARRADIPYVIIEMNPDTVRAVKAAGEPIFHGDATSLEVLHHAGLEHARVLAVVINDPTAVRRVVDVAHTANPGLRVLARARFVTEIAPLNALGADEVVSEEYETSLEIFTRVLRHYLVPMGDIAAFAASIRAEGYDLLRREGAAENGGGAPLQDGLAGLAVNVAQVENGAALDGVVLEDSRLREEHGLTVVAIRRQGRLHANPSASMRLIGGDVAYLFGNQAQAAAASGLFRHAGPNVPGQEQKRKQEQA